MKQVPFILFACGFVLFQAQDAFAADQPTNWADLGWRCLNFVLFIGIIWWAGGKKISAFLSGRRESIAQDLDDLEQARAEAQKKLRDLSVRIANVDAESQAILEESRLQAEATRARIIADAQRQAHEMLVQAKLGAENEARHMVRELRAALADEVVAAVENSLAQRLNPGEHERLITNALKKVVVQ